MARITKVFTSGAIGPVITYEFRGKPCVRAKPQKVRQTKATKASAKLFGKAAQLSRLLREELSSILPDPQQKDMMYRLNSTLFRWLQEGMPDSTLMLEDPSSINAFEFNQLSELSSKLKVQPTVEWTKGKSIIMVPDIIPSLVIDAPANTKMIRWNICVAGCSVNDPNQTWNAEATIDMPYRNKEVHAQQIELSFKATPKSITVVTVGLNYLMEKKGKLSKVENMKWLPCGVLSTHVQ